MANAEIQTLIGQEFIEPVHNLHRWYCHDCRLHGDGHIDGAVAKRELADHLAKYHPG